MLAPLNQIMPLSWRESGASVSGSVMRTAMPGSELADGAEAVAGHDPRAGRACRCVGVGQIDVGDRRGLGEAVAFQDALAEARLEGVGDGAGKFFRAGDDELEGGAAFRVHALQVAAQEGGRGDQDGDLVLVDQLGELLGLQRDSDR